MYFLSHFFNFLLCLSISFLGTFGAGGVGLTLTAASTIILNDRPWTPGDAVSLFDLLIESCKDLILYDPWRSFKQRIE